MNFTRRDWILGSLGSAALAAIASAHEHAAQVVRESAASEFEFFDKQTAAEVAVIAVQILPSDDGPGAEEAGIIYFIDRALKTFDSDKQGVYKEGIAELQNTREKLFPGSTSIAALPREQQARVIHAIEKSQFFEQVRIHTLLGFLGNPSYGGNRDRVGWKYIGFEDRMVFTPPFGFYDAEAK
jgi:gluconate 2-dehydrogenase gamma chain